jgi:type 1 fimbria pilin
MKFKITHKIALCALTLLSTQSVRAEAVGPAVDLAVKGTIVPSSCQVQMTATDDFEFGNIPLENIKDVAEGTDLGEVASIPLQITCTAETQVAINVKDNRFDSRVDNLKVYNPNTGQPLSKLADRDHFGLGLSRGKKIGTYVLGLKNAKVNNEPALVGFYIGEDVQARESVLLINDSMEEYYMPITWAKQDSSKPAKGTSFTGDINVRATVNKKSELNLASGVELDGSATLTVYYL